MATLLESLDREPAAYHIEIELLEGSSKPATAASQRAVDRRLQRLGCIVRPVANYGLPNHLRVSVGLPAENARFVAALQEALRE